MARIRCLIGAAVLVCAGCNTPTTDWHDWFSKTKQSPADPRAEAAAHEHEAKPEPIPAIKPETHLAAGRMLEASGDLNGAIQQYEAAIQADPKVTLSYGRLGMAYQRLGRYSEAQKAFRRGLDIDPNAAFLHNNIGYCFMLQSQPVVAEEAFRRALQIRPDFKRARMNLAMVLGRQGRMPESLAEFRRVISEDSANFNVGLICMQQRRLGEAERYFSQALAINPTCPGAREGLDRLRQMANTPAAASGARDDSGSFTVTPIDRPATLTGAAGDGGE